MPIFWAMAWYSALETAPLTTTSPGMGETLAPVVGAVALMREAESSDLVAVEAEAVVA